MLLELGRQRAGVHDRIAPVVKRDALGQQLGAETAAVAGDRVDADDCGSRVAPSGREELAPPATAVSAQVQLDLAGKDFERALDEANGPVRVPACSPACDLLQPAQRVRPAVAATGGEGLERTGERAQAVYARAALARALIGKVARDSRGLVEAAGGRRKDGDRTRAEAGTRLGELRVEQRQPLRRERLDPAAEEAAHEKCAGLAANAACLCDERTQR